ncbi:MAG: hypothetical protein RIA09_05095 [Hoeflea sp.]|uniref:hypothetical protein n=1 Tax=Hoeflea sp. TaxID=1940281 RepID=UPI0032EF8EF7
MIRFKPKADDSPSPAAKKPPEDAASPGNAPAPGKAAAKPASRSRAGTAKEPDLLDRAKDQDDAEADTSPKA